MAAELNFPIINVVRRKAQVELLKSMGAAHVLNSSDDDFVDRLAAIAAKLQATTAFEAIGGEMTGTLFNVLPEGSTVFVYGALSEAACDNIDPIELIFRGKTVTGFYLGAWLRERGSLDVVRAASRAQKMLIDGRIETKVQRTVSLEEAVDGLRQYVNHMTDGKLLMMPQTG